MVTYTEIRTTLLDSAYSTTDISDATITEYITIITAEVDNAANRHEAISGVTLPTAIKNNAIKYGSLAMTLYGLRTKGSTRGLTSDMTIISNETADRYQAKYREMLDDIRKGTVY